MQAVTAHAEIEGLQIGCLAYNAEVSAGQPVRFEIEHGHCTPMDGGEGGRARQLADQPGQHVGIGEMGVDHIDCMQPCQSRKQMDRLPRRIIGHSGNEHLATERTQPRGKAAFKRTYADHLETISGQMLEQPGYIRFHATDYRIADDLHYIQTPITLC